MMPEGEIPRYCVKCGRNFFARYDVIDAQILVWCPNGACREMQHTIPIFGFHSRQASQQRQIAEMIEQTESATNESQGSEFLRVHLALAEQNDTMIPCLAAGAAGMLTTPPVPANVLTGPITDLMRSILSSLGSVLPKVEAPPNCKLTFPPLKFSEKDTLWLAQVQPPKWNELGVPPALLQPENINVATARALNPSLDDLAAMERKLELLQRVRDGK